MEDLNEIANLLEKAYRDKDWALIKKIKRLVVAYMYNNNSVKAEDIRRPLRNSGLGRLVGLTKKRCQILTYKNRRENLAILEQNRSGLSLKLFNNKKYKS